MTEPKTAADIVEIRQQAEKARGLMQTILAAKALPWRPDMDVDQLQLMVAVESFLGTLSPTVVLKLAADLEATRARERALLEAGTALLNSIGEYVRQSMDMNPEWRPGIHELTAAIVESRRVAYAVEHAQDENAADG